jgi:hypothetical protein
MQRLYNTIMKLVTITILITLLISTISKSQNLTLFNDDIQINTSRQIDSGLDSSVNVFSYILYYQKDVFSDGFKSTERYIVNESHLEKIVGTDIYFNPSLLFRYGFEGFYKNPDFTSSYTLKSKDKSGSPNIFKVADVIKDKKNNKIVGLGLLKKNDDGTPPLFLSLPDFAKKSGVESTTFEDLGLIWMPNIEYLKKKYSKIKYHIAYHRGDLMNIPEVTDVPVSYIQKNKQAEKDLSIAQSGIVTDALALSGLVNYQQLAAFSFFFSAGMDYNYKKQMQKMKEFKEKQRNLLYDYDVNEKKYLTRKDFSENELWYCMDVKILEDSHSPVLWMVNSKNQTIFVLAKLKDLLFDTRKANEYRQTYGKEQFKQLFNGNYEIGMPVELVRFARGYENKQIYWGTRKNEYQTTFAYGKLWMFYENNQLIEENWDDARIISEKVIAEPVKQQ